MAEIVCRSSTQTRNT